MEEARILGILLRYGFSWVDEALEPTHDTTLLDVFLQSDLRVCEEIHGSRSLITLRSPLG